MTETIKTYIIIVFWSLALLGLIVPALWLLAACAALVGTFGFGIWAIYVLFFEKERDYS